MKDIRFFHSTIIIFQIRITQILNTLIDLNIIFQYRHFNNTNFKYDIINETLFFLELKKKGINWYNESINSIEYIQRYSVKYFNKKDIDIWLKVPMTLSPFFPIQFFEYFTLSLSESLYNAYYLFNNENYGYEIIDVESDSFEEIQYFSFYSLQNMINYNLPMLIIFSKPVLNALIDYNNKIDKTFEYIILILFLLAFIVFGSFITTAFITINQFGSGLYTMIKINQENVEEAIRNLENYSELYKKKLSFQFFYESAASRIQYYSEVLSKDGLTRIKKSVINNFPSFFNDNKKIINLKISFHVYLLLFIDIIFLIIIVLSIFYVIKLQINLNKDYLLSLSYIQFSFMDTSIKLLNMKCLISKITENPIEFSFFEENLLSMTFYETIKQLPEVFHFFYYGYLNDLCFAIYDLNSTDYINCKNNNELHSYNNTEGIKDYLLNNIEKMTYEYNASHLFFKDYNSYTVFTEKEYFNIMNMFNNYYIPVAERFSQILENSFLKKIKERKHLFFLLCFILAIWSLIDIFNIYFFFIPFLGKYTIISRDFLRIIPINYILQIPDLIKWMEKIDGEKI